MSAGPWKPIPEGEMDELIQKLEKKSEELSEIHPTIGIVPEDDDPVEGKKVVERHYPQVRPRIPTARAKRAPSTDSYMGQKYCDTCSLIGEHAPGCPAVRKAAAPEVIVDAVIVPSTEPSVRHQTKRIIVGVLKRIADRLEKRK